MARWGVLNAPTPRRSAYEEDEMVELDDDTPTGQTDDDGLMVV
jgi:hypothetical protein